MKLNLPPLQFFITGYVFPGTIRWIAPFTIEAKDAVTAVKKHAAGVRERLPSFPGPELLYVEVYTIGWHGEKGRFQKIFPEDLQEINRREQKQKGNL